MSRLHDPVPGFETYGGHHSVRHWFLNWDKVRADPEIHRGLVSCFYECADCGYNYPCGHGAPEERFGRVPCGFTDQGAGI